MGQQYIGAAILHHLEGFHIQSLDLGTLFSDSARTPEATLIQLMIEAKRHTPSVVFIPNLDSWYATITETTRSTFYGILRSLNPNDAILILGIVEVDFHELDPGLKALFGFSSENRHSINIEGGKDCLEKFFATAISYIRSKPTEFPDPENRKKRVLEELPEAPAEPEKQLTKQEIKQQEKKDMQLKNLLKVKLSGLMDLFKNRFKRFRKPPVDDSYLVHLFEDPLPNLPPPAYTKTDDDMILEVATGKKYFNIDLDIIEERLWNGFYSEPKQFLRDLEMIYLDANVTGDRERTVKASEMFANAQVAIEEIETVDPQFIQNCKELHQREITRQKKSLQKNQKEAVDGGVVGDSVTRNDISGDGESITDNIVQKMEDLADGSGPKEADSSAVASSLHTTTTTTTTSTVSTDASVATISSTATTITASTNHATMDAYDTKPELPIDISSKLIKGQKNSLSTHFDISSEDIEMHDDVDISLNGSANGSKDTDGNDGVALQPTPSVVSPAKTLSISALVDSTSSSSEKLSDAAASKEKLIENGSCSIELAEPEPLLILDELKLKDFTEHLIESCRLFNVEQLEQVNALITDQVWSLRHSWNRNEIIDKLYISFDEAKSVIESINSF